MNELYGCSIADTNQGLVDDGMVEKEKIGGSNYFWSFPAKRDRLMQIKHEDTLTAIEGLKSKVEESKAKLADAKRGREDEDGERAKKLARFTELTTERKKMEAELEALKENDPQALADLEKELKLVRDAAHRWTDNIFNAKAYLVKKRGMDRKEACRIIGITSAFDCKYTDWYRSLCRLLRFVFRMSMPTSSLVTHNGPAFWEPTTQIPRIRFQDR